MHYLSSKSLRAIMICFCFTTLASCTAVYFDSIQPKDGISLGQVPTELTGRWIDNNDTVTITNECLNYVEYNTDSLGVLKKEQSVDICLSDSVVLRKAGNYYVVNILDKENGWGIFIIERNKLGDLVWYDVHDPPFFGEGGGLRVRRVQKRPLGSDSEDIPESIYKPFFKNPLNPNLEMPSIDAVYYTGQFRKKHIKKFLTSKNIEFILKADGTIDWRE